MRRLLVFACMPVIGILLGGCPSATTGTASGTTGAKVSDAIAKVQSYTKQACGYLPIAKSVASIFNATGVQDAISVGDAICQAAILNPKAEGPKGGRSQIVVAGVRVEGTYVKRKR